MRSPCSFKSPQILYSHTIQESHNDCSEKRRSEYLPNALPSCPSRTTFSVDPRASRQHDLPNVDGNQERTLEPSSLRTSDRCLVCSYPITVSNSRQPRQRVFGLDPVCARPCPMRLWRWTAKRCVARSIRIKTPKKRGRPLGLASTGKKAFVPNSFSNQVD